MKSPLLYLLLSGLIMEFVKLALKIGKVSYLKRPASGKWHLNPNNQFYLVYNSCNITVFSISLS